MFGVVSKSASTSLSVDFAGEIHVLTPGDELTFGRASGNDITIDSNPRLHRHFGHVSFRDGSWWLKNTGRRLPLSVLDQASRSRITLTSGRETSLSFRSCSVTFSAGSTSYELLIEIALPDISDAELVDDLGPDVTIAGLTIDQELLVGEQRIVAVALAESALRNPHDPIVLPSNKSIAHRFDWPMTTFNRKLDRLCRKYARAGVAGLVGTPGQLASDRRRKLVEHLVGTGEITVDDLALLEQELN